MEFSDILYEKRDGVAWITINRPEKYNAFTPHTLREMTDAFADARKDSSIGVIVLTGAGDKAFCTGGDVGVEGEFTPESGRELLDASIFLSFEMRNNGKPIIAAVNGYAIGGGNELALLCDLIIASDRAQFGQVGPRMGSCPVWFGTQCLPKVIGDKKAREVVYLCRRYTAEEAERMGWINKVVPHEKLYEEVEAWCKELLERSPQSLRLAKISLNAETDFLWTTVFHGEFAVNLFYATEEFHEGCRAFLEKRKPEFYKFRK
ncbi:MAG: enoyl-CoA hydratase-related protein [Candidatus Syntropharchaeia archaeon]